MSFLSGGFFGGGTKETKQTTTNTTLAQDQRVQIGGSAGTLISPGASVASPGGGAIQASPYATVTQTISNAGMSSGDLRTLLDEVLGQQSAQLATVGASTAQLGDILAAVKTPEQTALKTLLPWLLLGVLLLVVWGKR